MAKNDIESDRLNTELYEEKKKEFDLSIRQDFLIELRNMITHNKVPKINIVTLFETEKNNMNEGANFGIRAEDVKKDLNNEKEDNDKVLKYLDSYEDNISIEHEIEEFQNSFEEFNDWFENELSEILFPNHH